MHAFHGHFDRLPYGDISDESAARSRGKQAVPSSYWFEMRDFFEQGINDGDLPVEVLICPSRRSPGANACDYAGFTPYWYTETTGGEWAWIGDPPKWKRKPFKVTIGIFARTILGDHCAVTLNQITNGDGAASTAAFTDKSVDLSQAEWADRSTYDVPWRKPGYESLGLAMHKWSDANGQYVLDAPIYFGGNIRRWPLGTRGMGSAEFYPDRNPAPAGFGSAHIGPQPVAFADGSVRLHRFLPAGSISHTDQWIVERELQQLKNRPEDAWWLAKR